MKKIFSRLWQDRNHKGIILLVLIIAFSLPAFSQNTKGDRPAKGAPKTVPKSKAKPSKERAKTKDISGRRLRTKNKSSALRGAQSAPMRKPTRPSRGDRSTLSSSKPTIKSNTAKAARSNVYPQSGPFINNPSKKPSRQQPSYSNKSIVKRVTGNASKRSSKNIYPNKGITNRVTQSSANRARNNLYPQRGPYVNNPSKTPRATQPRYSNRSKLKQVAKKTSRKRPSYSNQGIVQRNVQSSRARAKGNVFPQKGPYVNNPSSKPKKDGETLFDNRNFIAKALNLRSSPQPPGKKRGRAGSASGSYVTRGRKNVYWGKFSKGERAITTDIAGRKLRAKNYRSPALEIIPAPNPYADRKKSGDKAYQGPRPRFFGGSKKTERAWRGDISGQPLRRGKATKPTESFGQRLKDGGYQSRTGKGLSNQPIPGKQPGIGAKGLANFTNRITGKKTGKTGRTDIARYQGNIKGRPGFSRQGVDFSGTIKTKQPKKGGGSIRESWNNYGIPLIGKAPAREAARQGTFQGTFKTKRPAQGGGSISGRARNNGNQPIDVKPPRGKDAARMGTYQGNFKRGSLSPGFTEQGVGFAGNIKTRQPKKGGGSISGKSRNNNGQAVSVRIPTGKKAAKVGTYTGSYKFGELTPGFQDQGEEFSGFTKTKKPKKGGGSVSGKLWNNNEKPIDVRTPLSGDAKAANYAGKIRQSRFKKEYIKNPNAADLALRQKRPDETTYDVAGLQIKVKQGKFERNKKSSRDALLAIGPNKNSVKASEYTGKMKVYWDYKHNPSSSDEARKTIAGSNAFYKSTSALTSRIRMNRNYRHNPASDKEALKTLAPGKVYTRLSDFQGNLKMRKFNGKELHPDAKFAHNYRNNVKEERTILTNVKLFWTKVFRKNETQTKAVKENIKRPRYDKKEKELWKDLYE